MKSTEVRDGGVDPVPGNDRAENAPSAGWQRLGQRDAGEPERRASVRFAADVAVHVTTIDPVRDPRTGELCYETYDSEVSLNLSRRGACLRCTRPPVLGTRLLLAFFLPDTDEKIEVVARVLWNRVEYVPGLMGGRAVAVVGVEFVGGKPVALSRYERALEAFAQPASASPVVSHGALR